MFNRRRNWISILGLIASGASYYKPRTRRPGDFLASLPDSMSTEGEHSFPISLWDAVRFPTEPFVRSLLTEALPSPSGKPVAVIEFQNWQVAAVFEAEGPGFGAERSLRH
jgi:hypothetical protein